MPGLTALGRARLYWETLRHLRLRQVVGRIAQKVPRRYPSRSPAPPCRPLQGSWIVPARRRPSLLGPERFRFLNEEHELAAVGWDDLRLEKLWRYNLHYFEDLNADRASDRRDWHRDLIERWIDENPVGSGSGWEPFPTSLRIVNWVKWALSGGELSPAAMDSLAIQTRWLSRRLENHLLGNHLFTNAKALLFAGLFFDGHEAECWIDVALRILSKEVREQILADGGHFERSTMYHALALEDVLDLVNIAAAFSSVGRVDAEARAWRGCAPAMQRWLSTMCHPDGEISFFNDAAIGIAPSPTALEQYALRLKIPARQDHAEAVTHLASSGYVRVEHEDMVALIDVAPVGPEYLPGHAHADTLSFELSLRGERVLVNSGTSVYGTDPERTRQRGTAAHNTVVVAGLDSSEVWSGFRVARRARPFDLWVESGEKTMIACSHDGYQRLIGRPVHRREWRFGAGWMEITDTVEPPGQVAHAQYHLHPAYGIGLAEDGGSARILKGARELIRVTAKGGRLRVENTTYHPAFGITQSNKCLIMDFGASWGQSRFEFS